MKSKKGKEATATILSPSFWKDVKLTLTVFEPLVKVLHLVDGDVKPSMGFLFGELIKAKRERSSRHMAMMSPATRMSLLLLTRK